ncbi:MAG: glycogen/starch synthase [Candidatus Saccharimonadales bacterium]
MAKSRRDLKVLFVTAEVAPFSKQGGLSQVAYFLPRSLRKLGVDVRIFTPKYGKIIDEKYHLKEVISGLEIPTGHEEKSEQVSKLSCNVKLYEEPEDPFEPPVYFLENEEYFEKRANVYGYSDDHIRFGLLSRGALEFIIQKEFVPDVVHCNDWHTGYLVNDLYYVRQEDEDLKDIASLLSIHNTYQGNFNFGRASEMDYDDGKSPLAPFYSDRFIKQNALKRGVMRADRMNTVSETYARELLLEQYGAGMHKLFRELRGKMSGVLNGLDYNDFDPATDKIIAENFTHRSINRRVNNKLDLQKEFGLEQDPHVPIIAISGRLDGQKGLNLILETMDFVLKELDVQFIVLGSGDNRYIEYFEELERKYPDRVGTHLLPDFILPRKIFAGSDIMMMPSFYEPGGIVAIEAMRYGAVPLVRATGGLADIVKNYNTQTKEGTGFSFRDFSSQSFLVALVRALESYKDKEAWDELVKRVMLQDFSWDKVATKYADLYERTYDYRQEALQPNPPMAYQQKIE